MANDIYELVKNEETNYKLPIPVVENYEWSMYKHIRLSILYKNSQLDNGKDEYTPVKNITRPILNLQYRSEGFDVKDIQPFVNDAKDYYKSILIKKYHEKWARKNDIDTFIDELVESYIDFGGALVKDVNGVRPEVTPLQSIAFCDQTDILSGPICIKHNYAPDQLMEMESKGWGKFGTTLEEVITLAQKAKAGTQTLGVKAKTPGKYIEVYEIHGMFPTPWLQGKDAQEEGDNEEKEYRYSRQLHVIAFYNDENDRKTGITLYRGKEAESPFKLILRDKIFGRALGMGGAEELFEPQVWTNYDIIRINGMLDVASKMLFKTTDASYATRNKTSNLENGEIMVLAENTDINPINTQAVNITVFENSVKEWQEHAQIMGGATDPLLGQNPTAGTPFKLQDLIVQQGQGLHDYRKGKLATFVGEIYRDWILPYLVREITKGQEFLVELDLDELQQIADSIIECQASKLEDELVLSGQPIDPAQTDLFKQKARQQLMKGGSKRFMKILKDEMKDAPIDVEVNVAGKQKDLSGMTDKLTNIFRQIIAAPGILDDPRMAKLFNQILEASGLDPIDFSQKPPQPPQPTQPLPPATGQPPLPAAMQGAGAGQSQPAPAY